MSTTLVRPRPLRQTRHAAPGVRHLGPNWYAVVMGTAMVGTAGAGLPLPLPRTLWVALWALAAAMLAALLAARAVHWARHRDQARAHLLDPAVAPFYGCLAMALLAVGGGALAVGPPAVGAGAAVALAAVLFAAGTVTGLATAVVIPYLMVVRYRIGAGDASPVWLLPVVPPMVSAAVGPQLVPHLPEGQARATMLAVCLGLFGVGLLAVLLVLPLVFGRLLVGGEPPTAAAPALLLVLGPLGQSTTAASALADAAPSFPYAAGLAVLYGTPVTGFALLWLAWAGALVVRALRRGMRFAMTWWAFTFPVGTCVTGLEGLARHTGLAAPRWLAVGLFALLAAGWLAAASGTVRGLVSGALPAGPGPAQQGPRPGRARTR
ncbi:C4-dicarboxylate ABC transporter [Streptomyces sp. MUM 203J]|uniref:SLAC1 family transporter n=1 Tax=Streptomyces sp. MUM 203J TaxID=2791990 RepID=UPI001F048208|nr:C4-dicarboxylate ABC transporter [Streptomyces sp. MUM 203J]MCH0539429.1 C4-dicarboxylate ABC transporter [Streptomyces sp. MUM 203J]